MCTVAGLLYGFTKSGKFCEILLNAQTRVPRSGSRRTQGETSTMEKRSLRMVKTGPPAVGVCEACSAMFKSHLRQAVQSKWEIEVQFERHKCKLPQADQAAMRMAREAIPGK